MHSSKSEVCSFSWGKSYAAIAFVGTNPLNKGPGL